MDKLVTYLRDGVEVPSGTPGAIPYETDPIAPETGLYSGGMTKGSCNYRTALFVDGGKIAKSQCVPAALNQATYDSNSLTGAKIDSDNIYFNGIMVNDSQYTIDGLAMTADGSGGNDFKGFGAGISGFGASNVTVNNYTFDGKGALRYGVFAGGTTPEQNLTVTVKNSFVRADGSKYEKATEGMNSCPWMLGISADGHARATMCDGYSTVNYENDILLSDGWGVLSTDDTGDTIHFGDYSIEMTVKNSVIDVTTDSTTDPSCYATYSIGGCRNRFYNCVVGAGAESDKFKTLKSALPVTGIPYDYTTKKYGMTYAAVVANEYATAGWYDHSVVTTKYGVMYHKTNNVRYVPGSTDNSAANIPECGITEVVDSTFNTHGAAFLIKACTPVISVKNSKFNSDSGVIAQLMTCDDPGMGTPAFSEAIDINASVESDPDYNPYDYNVKDQKLFRKFDIHNMINDAQLSFADCNTKNGTALEGNFFNAINVATNGEGMVWWGQNMILSFDNCDIIGACSSSSAIHDKYSYFLAPAENQFGYIAINQDGYEISGSWDKASFGPPMEMDHNDMPEMPGGPAMPDLGGMPPMPVEPKFYFTPDLDANGNPIVIGTKKYTATRGCICSLNATYLGGLNNTPSPTVNNGVWVKLANNSVWTPVGTSYLTRLEIQDSSCINGTVTINDKLVKPEVGTVYTGKIIVTA